MNDFVNIVASTRVFGIEPKPVNVDWGSLFNVFFVMGGILFVFGIGSILYREFASHKKPSQKKRRPG